MLVEAPYTKGDTVAVKLNSGEEVIAKFEEEDNKGVHVSKPVVMANTPKGLAFIPFLATQDIKGRPTVALRTHSVVTINKVAQNISDAYTQGTSGIVKASPLETATLGS
tara:strand:- start:118 stop:444 length:327 start_codon:yes stop_codon:yes gene_type:complete